MVTKELINQYGLHDINELFDYIIISQLKGDETLQLIKRMSKPQLIDFENYCRMELRCGYDFVVNHAIAVCVESINKKLKKHE